MTDVDMWFDPACPWAWLTSRWLVEVERVRPINLRFHVMSLYVLNEGKADAKQLEPVRLAIAAEQRAGTEVLGPLYTALGTRRHNLGRPFSTELYAEALQEAGLPVELVEAAQDSSYDDAVRASHAVGMAPVGNDVGTPTIHIAADDGAKFAFFGPVVTPVPKGEAAARLWDGVLLVGGTPGFYELKRTRDARPSFD